MFNTGVLQKVPRKCTWWRKYAWVSTGLHSDKLVRTSYILSELDLVWGTEKDETSTEKDSYQSNMNSTKIAARANIKFLVKLGWKNEEIIDVLTKASKDTTPKKWTLYECIACFKKRWEDVGDESCSGCENHCAQISCSYDESYQWKF